MKKFLTAISCAVFLWTFWNASLLGIYVGTYTSASDGQLQCRYATAHGLFDEARAEAVSASLSSKWCPTTRMLGREADAHLKPVRIYTASGV